MIYNTKDSIAQWMRNSARPALHAIGTESQSWSKIGGSPNLEKSQSWPAWKGKPLAFLAQLDFSEMAAVAGLPDFPKEGRIFFFYDQEQSTWGFDPKDEGSWGVLFQKDVSKDNAFIDLPPGLSESFIYPERPIGFHLIQSLPDYTCRIERDRKALSSADRDELIELKFSSYGELPKHQIGGFPCAVQNDSMELECQLVSNGLYCGDASVNQDPRRKELEPGKNDWVLLFQLDSDDDGGMMWGDMGTLYFWIRRQELLLSDFSKVWMILQCG